MSPASKSTETTASRFVYIRALEASEVRGLLPPDALVDIDDTAELFMIMGADGQSLAIVEGREAAFAAALANDFSPLSVH